jgi:hypothetical protein
MVAGEGPLQAFTRAVSLLLLPCELPLDRKSAGLPERRFRLSHHHANQRLFCAHIRREHAWSAK